MLRILISIVMLMMSVAMVQSGAYAANTSDSNGKKEVAKVTKADKEDGDKADNEKSAKGKDAPESADADDDADDETDKVIIVKPAKKPAMKAGKDDKKDKATAKEETKPAAPEASKPGMSCPDKIEVASQQLGKKITGWGSFADADPKYWLEAVSVYSVQSGKLTRYNPSRGTEAFSQWELKENAKEKYFLVCSYTHTSLLLKQALASNYKSCRVTFENDPRNQGSQTMTKFSCE